VAKPPDCWNPSVENNQEPGFYEKPGSIFSISFQEMMAFCQRMQEFKL
jgi:hypothetical protein